MTTLGVFRDDFYPVAVALNSVQYGTTAQASGNIAATLFAGSNEVYMLQSGATALTTPTAAQIVAQLVNTLLLNGVNQPNVVGTTYYLRVINTNAGTLTLTGGTGVTITGTATLATATTRDFMVTVTGLTTVTLQSIGTGTTS